MIEKKLYVAADGKEFKDEAKCENYEEKLRIELGLQQAIVLLKKYCSENDNCEKCLLGNREFCRLSNSPWDW